MNQRSGERQSGAVASFVIIGVVLAVLVVGGIYFASKRSGTDNSKNVSDTTKDESKKTEENSSNDANTKKDEEKEQTRTESTNETPAPKPQKQTPVTGRTGNQSSKTPQHTGDLPTTGPAETMASITVGVLFVIVLGVYLKSYKQRFGEF